MFTGQGRWRSDRAQRWLVFLARHLDQRSTRDLAWWEMAPKQRVGRVAGGLVNGLVYGFVAGLVFGFVFVLEAGLGEDGYDLTDALIFLSQVGLVSGLVAGPVYGLVNSGRSRPAQIAFRFDRTLLRSLAIALWGSIAIGLGTRVVSELVGGVVRGPAGTIVPLLLSGPALLLGLGLVREGDQPPSPALCLRDDRTATVLSLVAFGLVGGLGLWVVYGVMGGFMGELVYTPYALLHGLADILAPPGFDLRLVTGLLAGLAGGLIGRNVRIASPPWLPYQLRRTRLALGGRLPWRFMTFLVDAHRLGVLRQVGAVYQFRHARLQDRLAGAAMETGDRRGGATVAGHGRVQGV